MSMQLLAKVPHGLCPCPVSQRTVGTCEITIPDPNLGNEQTITLIH